MARKSKSADKKVSVRAIKAKGEATFNSADTTLLLFKPVPLHISEATLDITEATLGRRVDVALKEVAQKRAAMKKDMRRIAASKRETRRLLDKMSS